MKLKTLKDLNKEGCINCIFSVNIEELKAEAIKWVQAFKKKEIYSYNDIEDGELDIIDFIQDFFNITEEDLK